MNRLRSCSARVLGVSTAFVRPNREHVVPVRLAATAAVARVPPAYVTAHPAISAAGVACTGPSTALRATWTRNSSDAVHNSASKQVYFLCRSMIGGMPAATRAPAANRNVQSHRNFSSTAVQANAESATSTAEQAVAVMSTAADPSIIGWWPSNFAEMGVVAVQSYFGADPQTRS